MLRMTTTIRSTVLAVTLLPAACASTPKTPATPRATAGGNTESSGDATAAPVGRPAIEHPLLDQIPETAVAAAVIRPAALSIIRRWLDGSAEMQHDLAGFLARTVGVDLTRVRGIVLFATSLGSGVTSGSSVTGQPAGDPRFAALLRLDARAARSGLRGRPSGSYHGVDLVSLAGNLHGALVDAGVVVGQIDGVQAAIDLAQGRLRRLAQSSPLGELFDADSRRAEILAGLDLQSTPEIAHRARSIGMRVATLAFDTDRRITLRIAGDPRRMRPTLQIVKNTLGMLESTLRQRMNVTAGGNDVAAGVAAIVSFYQGQALMREIDPELVDGRIVSRLRLPKIDAGSGLFLYGGILAAVAIPAFVRYVRKAKTVEATEALDRLALGLEAHLASRRPARGRRLPASTPWTPATGCCASTGATKPKCAPGDPGFDHPTFRALRFKPSDAHYYQYRVTTDRRHRQVTIEARGDLDCDGVYSSYKLEMKIPRKGALERRGPIITNEIE